MFDPTEEIRRKEQEALNRAVKYTDAMAEQKRLEAEHGKVWDTGELQKEFEVLGFLAPYVVVKRKSDGVKGSLQFQHHPRFYFAFSED